jgi:aerobic-type carbon monoxide dehydrogenase small subunit (CoxS/CutS family)
MKQINFTLNGKPITLEVQGEESLQTVLRYYLEHTGTKYGCGIGECGSCTVLLNKEAVRSCMVLAEDIADKDIITIEGLSTESGLHPIQEAFIAHDALQCGFCTSGMIMNAYGLLLQTPNASREAIITGMESNLCRCGAYNRIVDAIETAGKELLKTEKS